MSSSRTDRVETVTPTATDDEASTIFATPVATPAASSLNEDRDEYFVASSVSEEEGIEGITPELVQYRQRHLKDSQPDDISNELYTAEPARPGTATTARGASVFDGSIDIPRSRRDLDPEGTPRSTIGRPLTAVWGGEIPLSAAAPVLKDVQEPATEVGLARENRAEDGSINNEVPTEWSTRASILARNGDISSHPATVHGASPSDNELFEDEGHGIAAKSTLPSHSTQVEDSTEPTGAAQEKIGSFEALRHDPESHGHHYHEIYRARALVLPDEGKREQPSLQIAGAKLFRHNSGDEISQSMPKQPNRTSESLRSYSTESIGKQSAKQDNLELQNSDEEPKVDPAYIKAIQSNVSETKAEERPESLGNLDLDGSFEALDQPEVDPAYVAAGIAKVEENGKSSQDSRDKHAEDKEQDKTIKGESESEDEDQNNYPGGFALGILTFGLALATFVVALDNTIIATAIPKITTVFNSLGDVGWYGSSYLLTTTSLQPTFGKIYTYFDVKWTYLSALLIFEIGSILCAAAQSSTMLIVGRAVAGCGAAALFSGGMTIIGFSVPLRKRALFIALLSSMFGVSSVIGPLIGGVFTDSYLTWRWCFWINLPFGGVAMATVLIFFQNPKRRHSQLSLKQKIAEMDLLGAFFLICGVVCLLLALQWGGTTYPWSDSKVWGCLLGFGLIIAIFIGLQFWRGDRATIPPHVISQRSVASGCAFEGLLALALYTHIYYLPFYFQAVKGTSAEGSGIRTIPYLVSMTLMSIVVGGAVTAFGQYTPFMWAGAAIFTAGAGTLHLLGVYDQAGKWIGYQLLAGFGAGACIQIPFVSVQVVLPAKDMPSGNALTIFFNTLGGALGVSIAQNIFANTLAERLPVDAPLVNPAVVVMAGATHVADAVPPELLAGVLMAYAEAIARTFILPIATGGLSFLASLPMEMKSVKGKKLALGGAA